MTPDAQRSTPGDFGFERPPFHVTPDSAMVHAHRGYEEALAALEYGIETGKGFIVITGEVGTGKTTLLRHFLARGGERLRSAVIFNTGLAPDELLAVIADDLGAPPVAEPATRKRRVEAINAVLLEEFAARRGVVILIDEAQNLPLESFEILLMLSNLETETEKLLQIVLLGQPELRELMARPELDRLRSRVAVACHLEPMSAEETAAYLAHRLAAARPARPIGFSPRAARRLHRHAGGVPRIVNLLADQALAVAAASASGTVEADAVEAAIESFERLAPPSSGPWRGLARAALVGGAILAAVHAGLSLAGRDLDDGGRPATEARVAAPAPSAVAGLLRLLGAPAIPGVSTMTFEAAARLSGMTVLPATLEAAAVEAIGLPALVMPDNRVLTNTTPVLVTRVANGVWTVETEDQGRIELALRNVAVPLHYLAPTRPWMARPARRGMRGADIEAAQMILKRAGFLGNEPNGHFGVGTAAAVAEIQRRLGVDEGPRFGPVTMLGIHALERGLPLPE